MQPRVTIVTATFNLIRAGRKDFFSQCIQSIKDQTFKDFEHLIIDGASTDGTIELLDNYAKQGLIRYISSPDRGMVDAMNKGIKEAKGDLILILNSDDWYEKDAILNLVKALDDNQADYSYGITYMLSRDGQQLVHKKECNKEHFAKFFLDIPFNHEAMLCKKSVYQKLGYYNWEKYGTIADYDFIQRLILNDYKGAYVPSRVLNFRMDGTTNIQNPDGPMPASYIEHIRKVYSLYSDFYSKFLQGDLRERLVEIFNRKQTYLASEDLRTIESMPVVLRLVAYLASLRLHNYPYDVLFNLYAGFNEDLINAYANRIAQLESACAASENTSAECTYSLKFFNLIPIASLKVRRG